MTEREELYDSVAQRVIDNMDKQIAPMVWYALKAKNYEEVEKMMTRRQQLIDQMTARIAQEPPEVKKDVRRRKNVYR